MKLKGANLTRLMGLVVSALLMQGCVANRMADVKNTDVLPKTGPNEATVIFFRSSRFAGYRLASPIFDVSGPEPKFIGVLYAGKKLSYTADTRRTKRFMVTTWSDEVLTGEWPADFLDADLDPQRTYFVRVELGQTPRSGYTLTPISADDQNVDESLDQTSWIRTTRKTKQWADGNMVLFKRRLDEHVHLPGTNALTQKDGR
jgi:hypothetical protein